MDKPFYEKVFDIYCRKQGHQKNLINSCCIDSECSQEQKFESFCSLCQKENIFNHGKKIHTEMSSGPLLITIMEQIEEFKQDEDQEKKRLQLMQELQQVINLFEQLIEKLIQQQQTFKEQLNNIINYHNSVSIDILRNIVNEVVNNQQDFNILNQYFDIEEKVFKIKLDKKMANIDMMQVSQTTQKTATVLQNLLNNYIEQLKEVQNFANLAESGVLNQKPKPQLPNQPDSVKVSNDNIKIYAKLTQDYKEDLQFNMETFKGEKYKVLPAKYQVQNLLALTQDKFAATYKSDIIDVWDIAKNSPIVSMTHEGAASIWALELIQPELIATGGLYEYNIKIFNWKTGKHLGTIVAHFNAIYFICKLDDNRFLSGGYDLSIKCWQWTNTNKEKQINEIKYAHDNFIISCVVINKDRFITCGCDYAIKLWDASTWKCIKSITESQEQKFTMKINDDLVAVSDYLGVISFYRLENLEKIIQTSIQNSSVHKLIKLGPQIIGSYANNQNIIKFWNIESLECQKRLQVNGQIARGLLTLGQQYLVSGTYTENEIIIWH